MNLIVQIESIFISILFGMIFSLLYNLLYCLLYTRYKFINLVSNLFFTLVMFGLYYFLLYLVNDGQVHIYFLLTMFLSFFLYNKIGGLNFEKIYNKYYISFNIYNYIFFTFKSFYMV